jgi:hypothetical protein
MTCTIRTETGLGWTSGLDAALFHLRVKTEIANPMSCFQTVEAPLLYTAKKLEGHSLK